MTQSNHPIHRYAFLCVAALAPLSGCSEDGADETSFRTGTVDCPRWRCGYNTDDVNTTTLDGQSMTELHLGGQANSAGIELINFLPPPRLTGTYALDVAGDALIAQNATGSSILSGADLVGSTLELRIDGTQAIEVTIAAYEDVDSWASNGDPVAAYALVYTDPVTQQQRSVCERPDLAVDTPTILILAGERYDGASKTVIANQTDWITLACAGSATAKLALLNYGPNADFDGQGNPASVGQRQSTLKMITADYCGDGHSYTVDGTPLELENHGGTVVHRPGTGTHEAIWTANGAICLDTPRHVDPSEVACTLPSCATLSLDDGEWATYLPD